MHVENEVTNRGVGGIYSTVVHCGVYSTSWFVLDILS